MKHEVYRKWGKKAYKVKKIKQLVHQLGVSWFKAILGQEESWEIMDQVAMAYKWYNLCPQQELKVKNI